MSLFRRRTSTPARTDPAARGADGLQPPVAAPVPAVDPALAARREQAETIRRGGRPRTDNPRSKSLNVRFTESEWERVTARAERAGRAPRELAREALLQGSMTSAPKERARADAELTGQVARMGNNLNQIARALNEAAAAGVLDREAFQAAAAEVSGLRRELAGLVK